MKTIILLSLFSLCAHSMDNHKKFCRSGVLSLYLPMYASKIVDWSRHLVEEFSQADPISNSEKVALIKRAERFEYVEACENKEGTNDIFEDISIHKDSISHLEGVRGVGSNPALKCHEIEKPDEQWMQWRQVETRKFCEEVQGSYKCLKGDDGLVNFKYIHEIGQEKDPRAQCLLLLKQLRLAIVKKGP